MVIACIGSRFDWVPADVIDCFSRARKYEHYLFVLGEWLAGDWTDARFAWVVDGDVTLEDVRPALAAGLPLLVPEGLVELRELCINQQCGLYYLLPSDAEACLHRLVVDEDLWSALSANSRRAAGQSIMPA